MKSRRKISVLLVICMVMPLLAGMFSFSSITVSAVYPDPNGKYITPTGAGLKNGSSWEDAYGFNTTTFNTAWSATPSNGTLYVGSGTYNNASITASSSGQDSANPKKLLGVDTGSGKPVIHGNFTPTNGNSPRFFNISSGVNNINVENLRLENYYYGVVTAGNSSYIVVRDVDIYVTNDGMYFNGGGTEGNTLKVSNVTVENCNFYYYTKSGIRTNNRVEDVLISNCVADAGGQAYWYDGNWPEGFRLLCETSTLAERRFTFVDCTSLNNYWQGAADDYWNADGYSAERGSYDISFIRCKAFGSTDGGWDCKGDNYSFTDCIAMDNKRNFRLWGIADLTNCVGAYSYKRGGGYSSDGLWSMGTVTANYCTFYNNNGTQVETDNGTITLNDCIVGTNLFGKTMYAGTGITKNRTLDYNIANCIIDPQIKVYENSNFYGNDDRFNSGLYGNTKGYYCNTTNVYVTPTPAPATPTPVPSPGVTNLLVENFDGYRDVADVQAGGWTIVTPTPPTAASPVLAAVEAQENYKYLRTVGSTSASRTFAPVALKVAGGSSPGKNAKLVISYDAYTSGGTGSEQAYWKVVDSSTGSNAISAGRRGSTAAVRYAKSIPSPYTGLTISSGLSRFTRLKFVIKITDDTGAFLATGPKVDVYCGDMDTPVAECTNVNMIDTGTTKADKFYLGGASTMEVDNLNITLQADPEATPTPEPTPTPIPVDKSVLGTTLTEANTLYATASANIGVLEGQYSAAVVSALNASIVSAQSVYDDQGATQAAVDAAVSDLQAAIDACIPNTPTPTPIVTVLLNDDFNNYADIAAMQTAGWTVNLNNSTTPPESPVLVTTAAPANAQYFKVIASTSAIRTFAPVPLKAAGGTSPGKNAKLTITYDAYIGAKVGANYASYYRIDDSTNVAVAAGKRNASSNPIYYSKSIPSTGDKGLAITSSTVRFVKLKFVIKITDETGAFLAAGPLVDIYADDMDTPITGGADIGMIDSVTTSVNRFYLGGTQSSIEVDNLNITLQVDQ